MKKSTLRSLVLGALAAGVFAFAPQADAAVQVNPIPNLPADFIKGADVSMLPELEACGGKFYDMDGTQMDELAIMKKYGINWIRLRIWNNPAHENGGGYTTAERALAMTKRAHVLGMKVLIDFHYSDFWADPGKQWAPKAWEKDSAKQVEKDVYDYTKKVLGDFKAAGELPEMVQVGNEITNGMIWPLGKLPSADNGKTLASFVASGLRAVHDTDAGIKTMIHIDKGGDNAASRTFYDQLINTNGVKDFDVIGLSYYPFWHGNMHQMQANINDLAARYGKDVVIVETAFGYTNENFDDTKNPYDAQAERVGGFRSTVQGQATGLRTVMQSLANVPGGKGIGMFYWEPDWYAVPGAGAFKDQGDEWDNLVMFDNSGKALESWKVFTDVSDQSLPTIAPKFKEADGVTAEAGVGAAVQLPKTTRVTYTDDHAEDIAIDWETPAPVFDAVGTYTVKGAVTVDGEKHPVKASVKVVKKNNLIKNGDFESAKTLDGWTIDGDKVLDVVTKGGDTLGTSAMHYWSDKAFQFKVSRTFTGLKDGKYTLAVSTQGGGGQTKYQLFATTGGATQTADIQDTKWNEWHTFTIQDIEVKDGTCTVGVTMEAAPGTWGSLDNFEFYRQE